MPEPRISVEEWASLLLDAGTAAEHGAALRSGDPLRWPGYDGLRAAARGDESVRVFRGAVEGHGCVLIGYDFAHLGGSQGAGAGARVAAGFRLATREQLPVVTVTSTGGSRMQEGMVALAQMPRTLAAARAHASSGLLSITIASDPTTGGVYASFAAQGDLLVGEPGAYIGFAGRRVAEALAGELAADANTAEWAFAHGLLDAVVPRAELRAWVAGALAAVAPGGATGGGMEGMGQEDPTAGGGPTDPDEADADRDGVRVWDVVRGARSPGRPRAEDYVAHVRPFVRLRGDRAGGDDEGIVAGVGRLDGRPVAVVGLNRVHLTPPGYRLAQRLFRLAARLHLPVLTLVDTPGADPASEGDGLAFAIGATMARLLELPVPTVALVIGEGGSGGAMAFAVADRLLAQRGSIFSVIAPEGAAAILHRDAARAPEVAELLRLTAGDLVELGIADAVVPDAPAAALAAAAAAFGTMEGPFPHRRLAKWGSLGDAFLS